MLIAELGFPLVLVAVLLAAVFWYLYRIGRRNRGVADQSRLWQGRDYACPVCARPLEQGWVMLGKGAIWSPRGHGKPGTFAHIGQALPNTISLRLSPAANMAWRCPECRMLLIDHDKLVHD